MLAAISRGDIDIMSEVWINSVAKPWSKSVKAGKVKSLGDVYSGGVEGWFIPGYLAKKYPDLKSVTDLPKYKVTIQSHLQNYTAELIYLVS